VAKVSLVDAFFYDSKLIRLAALRIYERKEFINGA
jgi:hypothetical protein